MNTIRSPTCRLPGSPFPDTDTPANRPAARRARWRAEPPMQFDLNLGISNPNSSAAQIGAMDYILEIDGIRRFPAVSVRDSRRCAGQRRLPDTDGIGYSGSAYGRFFWPPPYRREEFCGHRNGAFADAADKAVGEYRRLHHSRSGLYPRIVQRFGGAVGAGNRSLRPGRSGRRPVFIHAGFGGRENNNMCRTAFKSRSCTLFIRGTVIGAAGRRCNRCTAPKRGLSARLMRCPRKV